MSWENMYQRILGKYIQAMSYDFSWMIKQFNQVANRHCLWAEKKYSDSE